MSDRSMTCERLGELLPEYLEDALDPEARALADQHAAACGRCATLIASLRAIAREARALPTLEPAYDLWDGIAARIEAPVIALDAPRELGGRRMSRWQLAAAAAGLVALTAGVTYTVTVNTLPGAGPVAEAGRRAGTEGGQAGGRAGGQTGDLPILAETRGAGDTGALVVTTPKPESASALASAQRTPTPLDRGAAIRNATEGSAEATYGREIERLRGIMQERRAQLDPKTVAIIEYNLRVIDEAITQSRAALAKDPASGLLSEQLNNALDKKLTLLRMAALLPART